MAKNIQKSRKLSLKENLLSEADIASSFPFFATIIKQKLAPPTSSSRIKFTSLPLPKSWWLTQTASLRRYLASSLKAFLVVVNLASPIAPNISQSQHSLYITCITPEPSHLFPLPSICLFLLKYFVDVRDNSYYPQSKPILDQWTRYPTSLALASSECKESSLLSTLPPAFSAKGAVGRQEVLSIEERRYRPSKSTLKKTSRNTSTGLNMQPTAMPGRQIRYHFR
ncbi:hypothetical protein ABW21_db0201003 [Orbilia brochopaga]|nr:hypothetical protein ABW21_db0201003 [Drechslerella brochopaga]